MTVIAPPSAASGSVPPLVLVLIVLLASAIAAQDEARETLTTRPILIDVQQDDIDALRSDAREWWEIKETARALWEKPELRDGMLALLREPALSPKVFTGLALHFAEAKERSVIPVVLDALAERDLGSLRETLEQHVMGTFHKHGSVFPELDAALVRRAATPGSPVRPGFVRLVHVFPVLVEVVPANGGMSQDAARYQAVERLLTNWAAAGNAADPAVGAAMRQELKALSGGLVDLESRAEWNQWFARFRPENDRDKSMTLQRVAQDALANLRSRIDDLTAQRRREVNDLIARMKTMGEPPTAYLLDADAAVRRSALRTLRGMADDLVPERRGPAVEELTRSLERADLDDERRRTLLGAAGAIGRNLPKAERPQLAAAIFKGPEGLGPEVWRDRLAAVAEIGAIDDPARLEGLYDLANAPARGADPAWIAVRADVIRACQTLRLDLALVSRSLRDPDEEVRGIAASTLAVGRSTWNTELVAGLVAAAVAEPGGTALTRMLEALRNIGRERPELLGRDRLVELIGIQQRASDANDARILGIVLHATLAPGVEGLADGKPIEDLLRSVFTGPASAADRGRLAEQILSSQSPLAARLLAVLLIETPTALDHDQTDRAVGAILAQAADVIEATTLLEIASRISGRADMPTAHRAREAAQLAGAALERLRSGSAPAGLDMDELDRRVEGWRMASGDADLIAAARAALDARVAAQPEAPEPLLRRAAFLEGLHVRAENADGALLVAAEGDLRGAIERGGALSEPALAAIQLRLARVLLLQAKFDDCLQVLDKAGAGDDALLLRHVHAVLAEPGAAALVALAGVGEEQLRRSPETYALLRMAARALSLRVKDRLAVSEALAGSSGALERELDGECRELRELDALVARGLENEAGLDSLGEAELGRLEAAPRIAAALVARRLLLLGDAQLREQGSAALVPVKGWVPGSAQVLDLPEAADEQQIARLRGELERLTLLEVPMQKRRAQFLKLLARTLYSL